MRIAIMGTRGIPANYGGFETFAEQLSKRLVQRGHHVTVYGRSNIIDYDKEYYHGVRLVVLPTIRHKYFDTVVHTLFCAVHSLKEKFDVILICNSANSYISFLPQLKGVPVAINVDGLEWQRAKWNKIGKLFYRISEWLATIFATWIVTDAKMIHDYYFRKFRVPSTLIPYGYNDERPDSKDVLEKFDLKPRKYILYVSRLEPENNAHVVVRAFKKVKTDMNLVIVGDAPYNQQYIQKLKQTSDPRVIFTGYVFGKGYRELQSNAYCYIQATEVGGTHPALVEAMGFGNCILANDVPEHREVLADAGSYFSTKEENSLPQKIQFFCDHPEAVERYRKLAADRAFRHYSWESVTDKYEALFKDMLKYRK